MAEIDIGNKYQKQKNMSRPQIVCLTPVRNEAWILRAFLSATSLWADRIIIADQMSTDGSREIARSFPKVQLLENNRTDIHMAEVRTMLMDAAEKIDGDKIIVTLDADEFWAGDFTNTTTWNRIINSTPDDVFEFKWMNILPELKSYIIGPLGNSYFNWVIHASESFFNGSYPKERFIHEPRLKWSEKSTEDKCFDVDDIRVAHFCFTNTKRQANKRRFYMVSSLAVPNNVYNAISLYRQYNIPTKDPNLRPKPIPKDVFDWYKQRGVDVLSLIDMNDVGQYYVDMVKYYINRDGVQKYAMLDIWNDEFCAMIGIRDPRTIFHKLLHGYLRLTRKYAYQRWVRIIDKVLKRCIKLGVH